MNNDKSPWPQPSAEQRERLERLGYRVTMNAIGQPIAAPPNHPDDYLCAWFELDFVDIVGDENAAVIDTLARLSGVRVANKFRNELREQFHDKLIARDEARRPRRNR